VDWIISYKSSFFSIRDVAFLNTLPMPHALKPNTCNNCFEVNLTKVVFGNDGHFSTFFYNKYQFIPFTLGFSMSATNNLLIIPPLHDHDISQDANAHFNMVWMSRTSLTSWKPPRFGLFYHQAMHFLQMLGQQPFGMICNNTSANFTLPFWPNLHPFFILSSHIRWKGGADG
jgi:hypothetical protein